MRTLAALSCVAVLGLLVTVGCTKKPEQQPPVVEQPKPLPPYTPPVASEQLPMAPEAQQAVPGPVPAAGGETVITPGASTYTVQKGDTLYSIARKQLGSAPRVKEIIAANPGIDANHLKVGQKINMPTK